MRLGRSIVNDSGEKLTSLIRTVIARVAALVLE